MAFLKSFLAPPQSSSPRQVARPQVTEMSVRRKLRGGLNESTTLFSGEEIQLLSRILERAERNPIDTEPFLTSTELSKLSLSVIDDEGEDEKGSLNGIFGDGEEENADYDGSAIPITAALTTPDNTPSGSVPIPPSVLAAMKVLQASPESFGEPATPEAIRAAAGGSGGSIAPQPPESAPDHKKVLSGIFEPSEDDTSAPPPSNEILQAFESTASDALGMLRVMKKSQPKPEPALRRASSLTEDSTDPLMKEAMMKIRGL